MPKQQWVCERCGAPYPFEDTARSCEASHALREEGARVKRFLWEHDANKRGEYPKKVVVEFSKNQNDFATYVLERIGFRGV